MSKGERERELNNNKRKKERNCPVGSFKFDSTQTDSHFLTNIP